MTKPQSFTKRTLLLFKPFRKYIIFFLVLMLIGQAIGAISPYVFGKSVDAVASSNAKLTIQFLIIGFALSYIQQQVLVWVREHMEIKRLDRNIEVAFSGLSLKKMLSFSVGQHINEHSGVKQNVVSKGQYALHDLMYTALFNIIPMVLQIVATLGILVFFDWRIAFCAAVFLFLYVFVAYQRNLEYFPKIDVLRKEDQAFSKLQSELFRNSTLVIAEAKESDTNAMFNERGTTVASTASNLWLNYLKTFYLHKHLLTLGQWITLALSVYLIFMGYHSVGMFVALFSWISTIFANVVQIMNMQRHMLFKIVEIKKYYELLDITPDINPNPAAIIPEKFSGEIEFKNVSFAYPYRKSKQEEETEDELMKEDRKTEEKAVDTVSFKIPAGAKVGFVGISGSGKSTMVNLMRRYYDPTEGEILIDGISLKEINLEWFRSKIGNVEQKIELFDRSIRDNIIFGLPDSHTVTDEQVAKAVTDASLDDFIAKLTDHGLETVIGEGGIKVSGGERQRIGIARALIKNPKILIFDEATSALDSINEKLIHDAINRGSKGRTTIIIAHRLSTVMDADIIFVVAGGKIVDQGTHAELSANSEEYKKLIANQILVG
ncbi:MAG: ABC transporter ATP-binding protein [Candidatus Pacebacteria bacterium]|nr:ABC transporter ATP-binding protein [Candidatus Paceibacterota bacterium]MBP9851767.1 ABC transporter ATP-binding protein [Candidatus Paceibacterota bacterium]